MILAGPTVCQRPVGLIDIFPTLLDLTGQQAIQKHEGLSIKPLLEDPTREWNHPTLTTFGRGNHSVRSTRWRYIHFLDGSEELYDHENDPHEWMNLVDDPKMATVISEHRRWLPKSEKTILGKGSTGHDAYAAAAAELK